MQDGTVSAPALPQLTTELYGVIFCLTQRQVSTPGIEPRYYGGILQTAYRRGSAALPSPRTTRSQHWTRCLELDRLICIYNALFSATLCVGIEPTCPSLQDRPRTSTSQLCRYRAYIGIPFLRLDQRQSLDLDSNQDLCNTPSLLGMESRIRCNGQ